MNFLWLHQRQIKILHYGGEWKEWFDEEHTMWRSTRSDNRLSSALTNLVRRSAGNSRLRSHLIELHSAPTFPFGKDCRSLPQCSFDLVHKYVYRSWQIIEIWAEWSVLVNDRQWRLREKNLCTEHVLHSAFCIQVSCCDNATFWGIAGQLKNVSRGTWDALKAVIR